MLNWIQDLVWPESLKLGVISSIESSHPLDLIEDAV